MSDNKQSESVNVEMPTIGGSDSSEKPTVQPYEAGDM